MFYAVAVVEAHDELGAWDGLFGDKGVGDGVAVRGVGGVVEVRACWGGGGG